MHYNNFINLLGSTPLTEHLIETVAANAYMKDRNGIYRYANEKLIADAGIQDSNIIGATDFDLPWRDQSNRIMSNDQEILATEKAKTFIEHAKTSSGCIVTYLSHKAPFSNKNGKIIGMLGLSFVISREKDSSQKVTLTQQQSDCLYYLIRGMSMKEIAKTLAISPRTVEHYLETVKIKLNCYTRSELITKGLQLPCIKYKLLIG